MAPQLSVVVVAYDMSRELPRTVRSLSRPYQTGLEQVDYELIVVDNGSPEPVDPAWFEDLGVDVRVVHLDPAPPSPARAANHGLAAAAAPVVGLIVDGARMASPGLLRTALLGTKLADSPVVASLGWHLGPVGHMEAAETGYDQEAEDRLLAACGWENDGYQLFASSTLAASSSRGWFGPQGESSALFMDTELWSRIGGLDEAFALPGGGLVNHDLYRRALEEPDTELVRLLGEGTFHQIHGGAATSRRFVWDEMQADYERLRGTPFKPIHAPTLYVGGVSDTAIDHLEKSVQWLVSHRQGGNRPQQVPAT